MITKNFGDFQDLEDSNATGSQTVSDMPPIAGSPMPNSGIRNKTMGNVFPDKDDPSPKQFSGRQAASKRMKGLPSRSPLGPITGGQGPKPQQPKPGQRPGQQPGQQQEVNPGDRWMGELWQGLTLNEQPQGGFAMGGAVGGTSAPNPGMDLYNQATQELESGGVSGYAQGGMVEQSGESDLVGKSREIASKGRHGDTILMHINPAELGGLQSLLGPITINPETGNPEALAWFAALVPMLASLGSTIAAGASAAATGIAAGATAAASTVGAGLSAVGSGIAGLFAPAAAGAAVPAAAATAPAAFAPLVAPSAAGFVPGGIGTGLGATAGTSFVAPATTSAIANSVTPAAAGISKAGLAKAAATGLSSLSSQGQQEQTPMGPAPGPLSPPSPQGRVPSPYDRMRKRQGGLSSLPGSRSII